MQTGIFTRRLNDIIKKLKVAELQSMIAPLLDFSEAIPLTNELQNDFANLLFEAREGYSLLSLQPETKAIVETLGIQHIFEPRLLAGMLTAINTAPDSTALVQQPQTFALFQSFFANLSVLDSFTRTVDTHIGKGKQLNGSDLNKYLEFEISDYDFLGVPLQRLGQILHSLNVLYLQIAKVAEEKPQPLIITTLDSGGDFTLGLQGTFKSLELMKQYYSQIWAKIKYKSPEDLERSLDSLGRGVSLFSHISRQEKNGLFDAETAEKIRITSLEEIIKLIGLGVLLKDIDPDEKGERKKIMSEKKDLRLSPPEAQKFQQPNSGI